MREVLRNIRRAAARSSWLNSDESSDTNLNLAFVRLRAETQTMIYSPVTRRGVASCRDSRDRDDDSAFQHFRRSQRLRDFPHSLYLHPVSPLLSSVVLVSYLRDVRPSPEYASMAYCQSAAISASHPHYTNTTSTLDPCTSSTCPRIFTIVPQAPG